MNGAQNESTSTVILKNDPDFPEDLDFTFLRKKGLEHIGKLSGSIWTDHNIHDPGITILEVLIYALIDLGYRSALPIEELLALDNRIVREDDEDDNFFTPARILSNNPLTIVDYRKLLLDLQPQRVGSPAIDIAPIRNAWLEIDESQTFCAGSGELAINGIYHVYVEVEPAWLTAVQTRMDGEESAFLAARVAPDRDAHQFLQNAVRDCLTSHRNLCEDFACEITMLAEDPITVCTELELTALANSDAVYGAVIQTLRNYFSPSIRYYTLEEMLQKGSPIETIFEGRPNSIQSFGFIDTEELIATKRRTQIHTSDLHSLLGQIDGIKSIRRLEICRCKSGIPPISDEWIIDVRDGHVPRLDMDCSSIVFVKDGARQQLTAQRRSQLNAQSATVARSRLASRYLDSVVPPGLFRADLSDYQSIQHDFPIVYGIGRDGLPGSASPERKVQALQLKGYLLFFDQLLADYLMQLSHLRDLFSMRPDSQRPAAAQHSYFTQSLQSVPMVEDLIRFYGQSELTEGTLLAKPISKTEFYTYLQTQPDWTNQSLFHHWDETSITYQRTLYRDLLIGQLQRDFDQNDLQISFYEDQFGHFFVIAPASIGDFILISRQIYPSRQQAQQQADLLVLIGSSDSVYRSVSRTVAPDPPRYSFEIIYRDTDYLALLQELLEDNPRYLARRGHFLDHLLARFSETFTDYTLLVFGSETPDPAQTNDAKARFLGHYDELSQNRGRGFDYRQKVWRTDNVSGFEKRVLSLAGLNSQQRRSLCHFEVYKHFNAYFVEVYDEQQQAAIRTLTQYDTSEEAAQEVPDLMKALGVETAYERTEDATASSFNFLVRYAGGKAEGVGAEQSADQRDGRLRLVQRLFRTEPTAEDIVASQNHYSLLLIGPEKQTVAQGLNPSDTEEAARQTTPDLLRQAQEKKLDLRPIPTEPDQYLNLARFKPVVYRLSAQYRWYRPDKQSEQRYESPENAQQALLAILPNHLTELSSTLVRRDEGYRWQLKSGTQVLLESTTIFGDTERAGIGWKQAKDSLKKSDRLTVQEDEGKSQRIILQNGTGQIIAIAPASTEESDTLIERIRSGASTASKLAFRTVEGVFMVQIADAQGLPFLQSYYLFEKLNDAVQMLWTMADLGRSDTQYYLSGDERNSNFSFQLYQKTNRFIAECPQTYVTADERNQVLQSTIEFLRQYESPVRIEADPDEYTYVWPNQETVEVAANTTYESAEAAETGFQQHILELPGSAPQSPVLDSIRAEQYAMQLQVKAFRYKFQYWQGEHPVYESETEFETAPKAKAAYRKFIKKPNRANTQYSTVVLPIRTDNQEFEYAYRVVKKDQPIAWHPKKFCHSKRIDCWPKDARKPISELYDPSPAFTDLCIGGDIVFQRELKNNGRKTGIFKYHFVLRERSSHQIHLVSYRGYDSRDEAEAAFSANFVWVVNYASDPDNYVIFDDLLGYQQVSPTLPLDKLRISLTARYADEVPPALSPRNLEPIAVVVTQRPDNSDDKAWAAGIARWANLYPIRVRQGTSETGAKSDVFSFRIVDQEKGESVVWESRETYLTLLDAFKDFRYFLTLLRYEGNYRAFPADEHATTPTKPSRKRSNECCFNIGISEVLLESNNSYKSPKDAWFGLSQMLDLSQADTAFVSVPSVPPNDGLLSFVVGETNYYRARHPYTFDTADECKKRISLLYQQCISNLTVTYDTESKHIQLHCDAFEAEREYDDAEPFGCLKLADKPVTLIWESYQTFPEPPSEDDLDAVKAILENLLQHEQNYVYRRLGEDKPFVIELVTPEAVLARHPQAYSTHSDVLEAIGHTRQHFNEEGFHLIEHVLLRPRPAAPVAIPLQATATAALQALMTQLLRPRTGCKPTDCQLTIETSSCATTELCWTPDVDPDVVCASDVTAPIQYLACTDPYSFWMTLVLPCWTTRFRRPEFRVLFENMLHRNAPAHVAMQIYWLGPEQFCEFEAKFKRWLTYFKHAQQSCPPADYRLPCYPDIDVQCKLIEFLNGLTSDCHPVDPNQDTDSCPCTETKPQPPNELESQRLNQRHTVYKVQLQAIQADLPADNEAFKRTAHFIEHSSGEISAYVTLLKNLTTRESDSRLLALATAYWLDKQVNLNPGQIDSTVVTTLLKVRPNLPASFLENWYAPQIKTALNAKVVNDYSALLKS